MRLGQVVTKEMILDYLYGGTDEPTSKSIDVAMHRLRKKLAQATGGGQIIATIRGAGYIVIDDG